MKTILFVLAACVLAAGCTTNPSGKRYVDPLYNIDNCHKRQFPQCPGAGN